MQRLKSAAHWLREVRYGTDTDRRTQRLLGVAGLVALVIVLVASAVFYVLPIGKHTYTALLDDAGSVKVGDDVRIAGISVGAVKSLDLTEDAVRMSFTVRDSVFVGADTSLEIRMLTPIGGHYLAVFPAGRAALGSTAIPAERVRLPYSLVQAIQDAQRPLSGVDGDTLRRTLADLTASLQRSPTSIVTLTDALSRMTELLDKQHHDVVRALDIADEYLGMLSDSRTVIGAMLSRIGLMETQLLNRRADVNEALRVASQLFARIAAVEPAWREQLEPLADRILAARPQLEQLGRQLGGVADQLAQAGDRLRALITPQGVAVDQSDQTITSRPVCVPVPGKGC
ncbi:MCE family protein [Nocardia brasiliensis]|uniref:MCE family protein n=1 Tax=Nocardia brasiliensis TaxID=37326 RepID=A0A6G9XTW0_NOCBR|nr:MlaD family protein [Nocardia brasiliensis]QIS04337.1 MCE family protein [Nocardia brasiliensis]